MISYSQNNEDKTFVPLLPSQGRLLEIGAFRPVDLSNSRALIERGWDAVLVEANPEALKYLLDFYRLTEPNDKVAIVNALVTLDDAPVITPFKLCWDAVSTTVVVLCVEHDPGTRDHLKQAAFNRGYKLVASNAENYIFAL